MFYESKKKKQRRYQAAVDLQKINKSHRRKRISAHAFQILQDLAVSPAAGGFLAPPPGPGSRRPSSRLASSRRASSRTGVESDFFPSKRLQDMFEKYEDESTFSGTTSSIDYEALVGIDVAEGGPIYVELCRILSMCVVSDGDQQTNYKMDDDDIELDIDYDAMLASDSPCGIESTSPLPDPFDSSITGSLPSCSPRFPISGATSPCVMKNESALLARQRSGFFS